PRGRRPALPGHIGAGAGAPESRVPRGQKAPRLPLRDAPDREDERRRPRVGRDVRVRRVGPAGIPLEVSPRAARGTRRGRHGVTGRGVRARPRGQGQQALRRGRHARGRDELAGGVLRAGAAGEAAGGGVAALRPEPVPGVADRRRGRQDEDAAVPGAVSEREARREAQRITGRTGRCSYGAKSSCCLNFYDKDSTHF
ncbi:hypothetical protein THAOC_29755, partial [Thalassiosira oceanica]